MSGFDINNITEYKLRILKDRYPNLDFDECLPNEQKNT